MSHGVYELPLRVRGYECGPDRTVELPVVASYFEHARWGWILRPAFGLVEGLHEGHFFVVQRQVLSLVRTFGIDTPARVRAALRACGRVHCEVDQDLVREDGVLLAHGRVTGVWIGPNGRPARIPDATRAAVTDVPLDREPLDALVADAGRERSFLAPPERLFDLPLAPSVHPSPPADAATAELVVRRSDCDMFEHVNGSNYLRYFQDFDGVACARADLEYRGQAVAGDRLLLRAWSTDDGRRAFTLSRADALLCSALLG